MLSEKFTSLIRSKNTLYIFLIAILFVVLFLHDHNLYPHLKTLSTAELSFLRVLLIICPLIFGQLVNKYSSKVLKILFFTAWLLLIPYTIYSLTEIRHIAELCHIPAGEYFTEICVNKSWMLAPVFMYAFIGVLSFVYSLNKVSYNIILKPVKRNIFVILICLYCAVSSTFGLYSRINVWELLTRPIHSLTVLFDLLYVPSFLFNTAIFSLFFVGIYYFVSKLYNIKTSSK